MPRRASIHHAISPHSSANAVNDVLTAISRKLISQHVETTKPPIPPSSTRSSIKMDHVLPRARKDKHRDEAKDPESRRSKVSALGIRPSSKSRKSSKHHAASDSPSLAPATAGKFDMVMESPPAILYGTTYHSNGAIVAGRLKFDVTDPSGEVTLDNFNMVLQVQTTSKKPVAKDCPHCAAKTEVIKKWEFLSEPKTFLKSHDNQFPWSHMLEGRMPAASKSLLGAISYAFIVTATTSLGEIITFTHPLDVKRAIPPGPDKTSIRIFPPTSLTGKVSMPPVVHPIGTFPVTMSLTGVVEKKGTSSTRWRLKKMMWRIEELTTVTSAPCPRHLYKVSEGKAIQHTDSKQLGSDEVKSGWKTDFDTAGGEITLDFEAQLATKPAHKVCCDVDSASGLEVKHNLIVELIVAEEFVPGNNSNLITPTGAARVLRMQFALVVSERAGMGISWEEEMPPMYDDVPPSPPGYGRAGSSNGAFSGAIMEDYEGPTFEYFDLERVPTTSGPPVYRERDPATINSESAAEPSEFGQTQLRQRLGGFRLDELEAEPQLYTRGRQDSSQDSDEDVDYAEGQAAAPAAAAPHRH